MTTVLPPSPLKYLSVLFQIHSLFFSTCHCTCTMLQLQIQPHSKLPNPLTVTILPPLLPYSLSLRHGNFIETGLHNSEIHLVVIFCCGLHQLQRKVSLVRKTLLTCGSKDKCLQIDVRNCSLLVNYRL